MHQTEIEEEPKHVCLMKSTSSNRTYDSPTPSQAQGGRDLFQVIEEEEHTGDVEMGLQEKRVSTVSRTESEKEITDSLNIVETNVFDRDTSDSIARDTVSCNFQPSNGNGAITLDPDTSYRRYYRDPHADHQREIWRPGNGDGDKIIDCYEQQSPAFPLEKRWGLYQLDTNDTPNRASTKLCPKYVVLDDCAGYEGAVGKPDADGDHRCFSVRRGIGHDKYSFTGEKNFIPIVYLAASSTHINSHEEPRKRKDASVEQEAPRKTPKTDQYTPRELLVKYNVSLSESKASRKDKKSNSFSCGSPSLLRAKAPGKPCDAIEESGNKSVIFETSKRITEVDPSAPSDQAKTPVPHLPQFGRAESGCVRQGDFSPETGTTKPPSRDVFATPTSVPASLQFQSHVFSGSSSGMEFPFARSKDVAKTSAPWSLQEMTRSTRLSPKKHHIKNLLDEKKTSSSNSALFVAEKNIRRSTETSTHTQSPSTELAKANKTIKMQQNEISHLIEALRGVHSRVRGLYREISALKRN